MKLTLKPEGVYRDVQNGCRFIVTSWDEYTVYGRREFEKDAGDFEPWSARQANFIRFYEESPDERAS
jgi:hypothetical protein